ncbi:hypothetical protein [Arthrobacter sp. SLBN-53]|uniref:hypothetical protein n=1 Tax=Arthrobacter sp. SLBN-53 TaxID=2768412 RepID=UPI0011533A2E|nr:hypothetical protein [Arthrobacter sp. SLBN-53]TQK31212.1 hypothetical protein FBY28_4242 [Arthrobacter sp. SLBN-53]
MVLPGEHVALDGRGWFGAGAFETEAVDELAGRHVEMYFVLARFLRHAVLQPWRYRMREVTAPQLRAVLRGIEIRWPSPYECADRLAAGRFPAAGADPK